jgi:hypothetical protein
MKAARPLSGSLHKPDAPAKEDFLRWRVKLVQFAPVRS